MIDAYILLEIGPPGGKKIHWEPFLRMMSNSLLEKSQHQRGSFDAHVRGEDLSLQFKVKKGDGKQKIGQLS